jgi:hypothetical protein
MKMILDHGLLRVILPELRNIHGSIGCPLEPWIVG